MSALKACAILDCWELNPDGKSPGIFIDDPEGGDPMCLAIFSRVYHPELLHDALAKEALLVALHDAIAAPKGVVPASAEAFYDQTRINP